MVYSFFEPSEVSRSLGTFMILDHIARARRQGLPYVYLGYWIEGSKKMDYKGRFLPQQRLAPSGWLRIDASGEVLERAAGLMSASRGDDSRPALQPNRRISNSSLTFRIDDDAGHDPRRGGDAGGIWQSRPSFAGRTRTAPAE